MPSEVVLGELFAQFDEFLHVVAVERLGPRHVETRRDVGEVEIDPLTLGRRIYSVEIADPLILDQSDLLSSAAAGLLVMFGCG